MIISKVIASYHYEGKRSNYLENYEPFGSSHLENLISKQFASLCTQIIPIPMNNWKRFVVFTENYTILSPSYSKNRCA